MSNELQSTNVTEIAETTDQLPVFLSEISNNEWLPLLSVCTVLSDSFKESVAKPGEFVLSNTTSLGKEISAVYIDCRMHAASLKKGSYTGHYYINSDWRKPLDEHEGFTSFKSGLTPQEDLLIGLDLFLFLPDCNSFCSLFCKNTMLDSGNSVVRAGTGKRLLKISTVEKHNKAGTRSWFILNPIQTEKSIDDISYSKGDYTKYYNMFKTPTQTIVDNSDTPERER